MHIQVASLSIFVPSKIELSSYRENVDTKLASVMGVDEDLLMCR